MSFFTYKSLKCFTGTVVLTLCLLISGQLYAQSGQKFYFDEITVSINKTNLKDDNTQNLNGYGVALKHNSMAEGRFNILYGIEYNHTSLFKKTMYEGHYANSTNVTYVLDYLTFPISGRINFGKRFKVFLSGGLFVELGMSAEREGIMHTYPPNQPTPKNYRFRDNTGVSVFNCGPSFGAGFRIPAIKHEIILLAEYKYGMTGLADQVNQLYNRYIQLALGFKI